MPIFHRQALDQPNSREPSSPQGLSLVKQILGEVIFQSVRRDRRSMRLGETMTITTFIPGALRDCCGC
ncbi:hypothetical protein B0T26DRAFT_390116 [Lasiosphaeria miniovina]|uniref:Uncharacterized protein n=1 Tax=Lasiosphaeria miniovina TaxID=1954250 RepID=A0AA40A493_9PEZI|nr:uncharacterized protein B0T26DRAFT_390116 [Lasiosphaeria miniovina]KAK0709001.1 hypothetical protein B0T26DRAFT_390116 [Lasiosphaeria miniovina]